VFYPLFLELQGRRVLVVGGGIIAERKVESVLAAGASVTVVAPDITEALRKLAESSAIHLQQRKFTVGDLEGVTLVISATNDSVAQEAIVSAARARGILINTVDQPELCDFIVPAIVRKGHVVLALSTSGRSPALAAALRLRLEGVITDDVARAADVLGKVRSEVHLRFADPDRRKQVFEAIVASGILDWIGECDDDAALARVRSIIDNLS
jgi:precorrin-2 dehydrogenase/sirohydrochlorin ferrochelatase